MRSATFVLPALLHTFLLVSNVYGSDSIRTKPRISRQGETPEGSGAFLVSHAGFDDAKNWCLTAKNGVRNGAQVGLALCDFDEEPLEQLFLLSDEGRIHSKLDPSQCFFVAANKEINRGHSRLKFHECDQDVSFGTFIHNRGTGLLQVENEPDVCIKQNGPRPQKTDAIRAYTCDEDDMDFTFDYVDLDVNPETPTEPIPTAPPPPTAAPSPPGTAPPGPCNTEDFGTECCSNEDCPADLVVDYFCEERVCITDDLILSTINGADAFRDFGDIDDLNTFLDNNDHELWCLAATDESDEVAFEICDADDFDFDSNLLWHVDTIGRVRSDFDITRCLTVDANGSDVRIGSCDLVNSVFDIDNQEDEIPEINLRFFHNQEYCVTRDEASVEGKVTVTFCEEAGVLFLKTLEE